SFVRFICNIGIHLLFKIRTNGIDDFPEHNAVIVYSNHKSMWDPVIIGCLLKRPIYFMAKEELFSYPLFGFIIKKLNAFPVKRGTPDRKAIKKALQVLNNKQVLGIFPEGTRSKDGKLLEPESGVALIAAKSKDVMLVPVAICGSYSLFSSIDIKFGKAKSFDEYRKSEKLTSQELKEISISLFAEVAKLMSS
ncbi:MAG: 1-acyl-sn-glycerol-3-phosphate acyltransferase, partial [Thermoanaerobacteraceae bacterium]|nr:1-acyl-sn-glycerol-3-phosphate acyltransferase [Thermoanaerobacteraceae bacterium]